MKKKTLVIAVLFGLLTISCEKMELTKLTNASINESTTATKEALLFPLCQKADAVVGKIGISSVVGNTINY